MPSPSSFETDHAVTELLNHQGYRWVIEQIQAESNTVENQLEKSDSNEKTLSLHAQWVAYRKVLRRLRNLPLECEKKARAHMARASN